MKFISHRGASLIKQENSVEGLILAAQLGADGVECDIRQTKDGVYVLFHDPKLTRCGKDDRNVCDVTYDEMREILAAQGYMLSTLNELFDAYKEKAFVLLDIAVEITPEFLLMIKESGIPAILGTHNSDEVNLCAKYFPSNQILAFMPEEDLNGLNEYKQAGIIRLWEQWTEKIVPEDVKKICPDSEVFIMSNDPQTGLDGNTASIKRLSGLNADGILLNNIEMALKYKTENM